MASERGGPSPFDADHLLFDNQAGVSIIRDVALLHHLRKLKKPRGISGIGDGTIFAEHAGWLGDLGIVLWAPGATANVLSQRDCDQWGFKAALYRRNGCWIYSN